MSSFCLYHRGPEEVFKFLSAIMETNALLWEKISLQEQIINQQKERLALQQKSIKHLEEQVVLLKAQLAEFSALKERVEELEAQKKKNSRNSSKPPSSDDFIKPKSRRKKSDKPPGGQKGHAGHTLKMVDTPDHIIICSVDNCKSCGHSLKETTASGYERCQRFDLPELNLEVTEYQAEIKRCAHCDTVNKGAFPEEVPLPVQYGNNIKAFVVYCNQQQLIPYERTRELIRDIFNHEISEGTLFNFNDAAYQALETTEETIKEKLISSTLLHLDETGIRVAGARQWLHVSSTDKLTFYAYHAKRGSGATDEIGILPRFEGTAVHDYRKSYLNYKCAHSLCNAHHLRELTGILENTGQTWCQEMIDLLLEIKSAVDDKRPNADRLTPDEIKGFETRYNYILEKGYLDNPPPFKEKGKRGRTKQSKAKNMLDRLRDHQKEVLAFMYDFTIPFDNNLAERDLRMVKVKQKISGVFRSAHGANMFCRIRGYISTARKNSVPILKAIKSALEDKPFVPEF